MERIGVAIKVRYLPGSEDLPVVVAVQQDEDLWPLANGDYTVPVLFGAKPVAADDDFVAGAAGSLPEPDESLDPTILLRQQGRPVYTPPLATDDDFALAEAVTEEEFDLRLQLAQMRSEAYRQPITDADFAQVVTLGPEEDFDLTKFMAQVRSEVYKYLASDDSEFPEPLVPLPADDELDMWMFIRESKPTRFAHLVSDDALIAYVTAAVVKRMLYADSIQPTLYAESRRRR